MEAGEPSGSSEGAGWPASVESAVKLKCLEPGMEADLVYRLLGPPNKKDMMAVYAGTVEMEQLEVWSYDADEKWLQIRFKKEKIHNWRYVVGR
jgi:hypothetical protein